MLTVTALMATLLLEASVQELRIARGDVAGARAEAAAGTALADLLASRPDSAMLGTPRGAVAALSAISGTETTRVSIRSLGNGMLRVTASARAWSAGVRGDAAIVGFARIIPDPAGAPGRLRYRTLPGWWWAPLP
jgi:hypothetical protein